MLWKAVKIYKKITKLYAENIEKVEFINSWYFLTSALRANKHTTLITWDNKLKVSFRSM